MTDREIDTDWFVDTQVDKFNLDEECVRQAGLFGFWAHQELQCIKEEDGAAIELEKAEANIVTVKARVNADMRGLKLEELNKLLKTKLPKLPDVALWKELVLLHPEVEKAQAERVEAQRKFIDSKYNRLDRKNARKAMEVKAIELNNLIYLHNREYSAQESWTSQPAQVKQLGGETARNKAQEAMATALKKKISAGARIKP